jgi:DNA polymerase III delta subunit
MSTLLGDDYQNARRRPRYAYLSALSGVRISKVITVLTGDNGFELKRALDDIVSAFDGAAEKFEGAELQLAQMPDLLMGATLFADKRLIVIKGLSENRSLWDALPDWLPRVVNDIHVVLVEQKPDKRTKTYKDLKKFARVKEFAQWGDRDLGSAENWVLVEAKRHGMTLNKKSAQLLVARIGIDQWQLYHALQKLAVLGEVTTEIIENTIEATPTENVFNLLDAALRGDSKKVVQMISTLQRIQDPFMTFGLLSGQVFQLAALAVSDKPSAAVASDIGAHPFAVGKLAPHAKKIGQSGARKIVRYFADADTAMKSTATDPWLLIEEALIKTASV